MSISRIRSNWLRRSIIVVAALPCYLIFVGYFCWLGIRNCTRDLTGVWHGHY